MTRYKDYDYSQGKFIPIQFHRQILPGTFEYSLHYLIDNISVLRERWCKCNFGKEAEGSGTTFDRLNFA